MRRLLETAAFLALAVGLHVAVAIRVPSDGGSDAGGQGGQALVSLQGAAPGMVEMVKAWETPPEVAQPDTPDMPQDAVADPAPLRPVAQTTPRPAFPSMELPQAQPDTTALPKIEQDVPPPPQAEPDPIPEEVAQPAPEPQPEPEPEPEQVAESPLTPALSKRPQPRPEDLAIPQPREKPTPKAVQADRTQKARKGGEGGATQRAAGNGGSQQAGTSNGRVKAGNGKAEARLEAVWGSQIRTRIERRKRFPGGLRGQQGRVVVRITVGRDGNVLGAQVVRSSGIAAFDQAAMAAIQRSGRMPAAPAGLSRPSYAFNLPMDFS
ncbi:TonB family protein [Pseudooceanicola sediminis]|uniref:TonB family protein n=1 Tax=Pseudooceanicola sediminis TaxID=2211117 RepID=A0A399J7H2_9RHOB|nr:energy transducer TonB [Pseudooceanicola sediminis]KAA2314199.1 TonB family protein [Puniceibacterium sp. HSS470]RII39942.1 TonB family protein [Pseudooceanicola sediminis]|tara:strand:+ start:107629 stop:108594 length:966 start_codon:yes stop_codon:yes gene_type:complete